MSEETITVDGKTGIDLSKQEVINIFMERDGMTYDEAIATIDCITDDIEDCDFDPEETESIMRDHGLEPDYILAFIR